MKLYMMSLSMPQIFQVILVLSLSIIIQAANSGNGSCDPFFKNETDEFRPLSCNLSCRAKEKAEYNCRRQCGRVYVACLDSCLRSPRHTECYNDCVASHADCSDTCIIGDKSQYYCCRQKCTIGRNLQSECLDDAMDFYKTQCLQNGEFRVESCLSECRDNDCRNECYKINSSSVLACQWIFIRRIRNCRKRPFNCVRACRSFRIE